MAAPSAGCTDACMHACACSVASDSLQPRGLQPTRLLCPWDSPGKSTGVGCHFLFQRTSPTQGQNPGLLHWQADSSPLSHLGVPQVQEPASKLVLPDFRAGALSAEPGAALRPESSPLLCRHPPLDILELLGKWAQLSPANCKSSGPSSLLPLLL